MKDRIAKVKATFPEKILSGILESGQRTGERFVQRNSTVGSDSESQAEQPQIQGEDGGHWTRGDRVVGERRKQQARSVEQEDHGSPGVKGLPGP